MTKNKYNVPNNITVNISRQGINGNYSVGHQENGEVYLEFWEILDRNDSSGNIKHAREIGKKRIVDLDNITGRQLVEAIKEKLLEKLED